MIATLHIVRRGADCYPLRIAERGGPEHAVLLIGDGVYNPALPAVRTFVAAECARQRGVEPPPGRPLDDAGVIALVAQARQVISW